MKSRSNIQIVFLALMVLASACTKKKELKNQVESDAYIAKSDVLGAKVSEDGVGSTIYSLSKTIQDVRSSNQLDNALPGPTIDFGLVQFQVTKTELRLIQAYNPENKLSTANILASYPIVKHFDIVRETNDFGEQTNKVVEDTEKPWNKRKYMRVDWAHPTNNTGSLSFATMYGVQKVNEASVNLVQDLKKSKDHLSYIVEAALGDDEARVEVATHLQKVDSEGDYKKLEYTETDFSRFGMFYTEQRFEDPERGLKDKDVKHYVEKFDLCEADQGRACSTNVVEWKLTDNYPEEYVDLAQKALAQYNTALKKILKRSDDVIVLNTTDRVSLGDTSANVIGYYGEHVEGGILGIRSGTVDPRNGKILSGRLTIYGSGIQAMRGEVDEYIDMLIDRGQESEIGMKNDTESKDTKEGQLNFLSAKKVLNVKLGQRSDFKSMLASRKVLGIAPSKRSVGLGIDAQLSDFSNLVKQSSANSRERLTKMINNESTYSFFNNEATRLDALNLGLKRVSVDGSEHFAEVENLLRKSNTLLVDKNAALNKKTLAGIRKESNGEHNVEFIEDAVRRFLERKVIESGKDGIESQREYVKTEAAKLAMYHVMLHELGHVFGLRHNFAGSVDKANFTPEYQKLIEKLKAGDKSVHPLDLAGAAYSSIMDYAADFFLMDAGLGPYDVAALEYAYSSNVDRSENSKSEVVKRGYKFCTDDNADEDIDCRRWDRGTNASEITAHEIDTVDKAYLLSHFRRERANWSHGVDRVIGTAFFKDIRIRQPIDEMIYRLMTEGGCGPNGSITQSIARKEMLDICKDQALAERVGIDLSDLSTFSRALYDEKGQLLLSPVLYKNNGFADLLFASEMAIQYFQKIIGAPEPGRYLVEGEMTSDGKASGRTVMTKLPDAANKQQALAALAQERGLDPNEFVASTVNSVLEFGPGVFAKYFESQAGGDEIHRRVESIGFFWDKYVAMNVLGMRNIGVRKYAEKSMVANAYLLPHTRKVTHKIFEKLIASTGEKYILSVPIQMTSQDADGKPKQEMVDVLVPASSDTDLEAQAAIIALATFSTPLDQSFAQSALICVGNNPCPAKEGLKFVTFEGNVSKFKAPVIPGEESLSGALLSNGAELQKSLAEVNAKLSNRSGLKSKLAQKAKAKKNAKASKDLEAKLTAYTGNEAAAKAHAEAHELLAATVEKMDVSKPMSVLAEIRADLAKLSEVSKAFNDAAKEKMKGVDLKACQAALPQVKPGCEPLAEAIELQKALQASQQELIAIAEESFGLAYADKVKSEVVKDIGSLEDRANLINKIHSFFN